MDRLPYRVCEPVYTMLGLDFHPEQMAIIEQEDRFPVIGGGEGGVQTWADLVVALKEKRVKMPDDGLDHCFRDSRRDEGRAGAEKQTLWRR